MKRLRSTSGMACQPDSIQPQSVQYGDGIGHVGLEIERAIGRRWRQAALLIANGRERERQVVREGFQVVGERSAGGADAEGVRGLWARSGKLNQHRLVRFGRFRRSPRIGRVSAQTM